MSAQRTFTEDLAQGQRFEDRVLNMLGGTRTSSQTDERDRGDLLLPNGTYVECKHDKRFDETDNVAFEIADLAPREQTATLTGVFKHSAYAYPSVVVHGLGHDSQQVLVYSPFELFDYFASFDRTMRARHPRVVLREWRNGHSDTTHRTAGLVMPLSDLFKSRSPRFPVDCVPPIQLATSVAHIANRYDATPRTNQAAVYEALTGTLAPKSADLEISRCRRVKVKGNTSDQVHALVRG